VPRFGKRLTRVVMPGMLARSRSTIINVASLLAFGGADHQVIPGHLQPGTSG
jgi:NADP-dependent 3-hydroxy acid dehydrogenase YdfG